MTVTTVEEYRALSDRATVAWRRAVDAQNAAQLITVHILCRVIRTRYPDSAYLVLTPNEEIAGRWEAAEVRDAGGSILAMEDEIWDLAGPDISTNDVSTLVGDLESDMDWEAFAPHNSDRSDYRRYLDIAGVLAAPLPGSGS